MRILAFIQDTKAISDIMKAQGIPDLLVRRSLSEVGRDPRLRLFQLSPVPIKNNLSAASLHDGDGEILLDTQLLPVFSRNNGFRAFLGHTLQGSFAHPTPL